MNMKNKKVKMKELATPTVMVFLHGFSMEDSELQVLTRIEVF
jgi:hypothetical protein